MITTPTTLTDPPSIVALKREFYELSLKEESLKEQRAEISQRKQEIAHEIFTKLNSETK